MSRRRRGFVIYAYLLTLSVITMTACMNISSNLVSLTYVSTFFENHIKSALGAKSCANAYIGLISFDPTVDTARLKQEMININGVTCTVDVYTISGLTHSLEGKAEYHGIIKRFSFDIIEKPYTMEISSIEIKMGG
jgi:hypothetical protein